MSPSSEGQQQSTWDKFLDRWVAEGDRLKRTGLGIYFIFIAILVSVYLLELGVPHDRPSALNLASYMLVPAGILLILVSQPTKKYLKANPKARPRNLLGALGRMTPGLVVLFSGIALQYIVLTSGVGPITITTYIIAGSIVVSVFGAIQVLTGWHEPPTTKREESVIPHEHAYDEWKETRDLIAKFDDKRHEIRKYGVSFVAGLLTAQAIIGSSTTMIPHGVKFAVIMATFVLIIAMRLTEEDYQHFIQAAVGRAIELEGNLNFELTERINERYTGTKNILYLDAVYSFMAIAAGIFGYYLLSPAVVTRAAALDIVTTILAVTLILYVGHIGYGGSDADEKYRRRKEPAPDSTSKLDYS